MDFGFNPPGYRSDRERRGGHSHEIKVSWLAVHVDTSTSVVNYIAGLRAALYAADHPACCMVDCIALLRVLRRSDGLTGVRCLVTPVKR